MKKVFAAGIILFVVGVVALSPRLIARMHRERIIAEQRSVVIPEPEQLPLSSSASSVQAAIRASVNHAVPFTPQAPLANWDALHEEACEEASVLMVVRYFARQEIGTPEEAETEIQRLVARNAALGFPVDDTAEEVTVLLRDEDPSLSALVVENPTPGMLRTFLAAGNLIIVPAQGQQLGNPFFTAPGPRYHMLVLKGYTEDGYFITNDPGTKRGKDYVYRERVLMDAIHDWNGGDVENGAKRVIVVGKGEH